MNEIKYTYGCENKKYHVEYYPNQLERQEQYGMTLKVNGIVKHFDPSCQIAIQTAKCDFILIDSRLIAVMRPMNEFEIKDFEKLEVKNE